MNAVEGWLSRHPRERFFRNLAMVAIVILGGLAYYGLHRDIEASVNPCVASTDTYECAHYACGIGQYLPIPLSRQCNEVLGKTPAQDTARANERAGGAK